MIFWSRNWSCIAKLYIFTKKQDILRFAFAKVMFESWVVFVMVLLWPGQNFAHRCMYNEHFLLSCYLSNQIWLIFIITKTLSIHLYLVFSFLKGYIFLSRNHSRHWLRNNPITINSQFWPNQFSWCYLLLSWSNVESYAYFYNASKLFSQIILDLSRYLSSRIGS